jgi:hypothetical protein
MASPASNEPLKSHLELHHDYLVDQVRKLRDSTTGIPPDVEIVCQDGHIVPAHKFILQLSSKYFEVTQQRVKMF